MRIGVVNEETWAFLHEIYAEFTAHHQTSLFKRRAVSFPAFTSRINQYLFKNDLNSLMKANDVIFFEWASEVLAAASRLPKQCGIVTRLHRYEMYKWVDRINWDFVDKIILVSQAKKQEFISRFPEQASKIEIIYEAVDPYKFKFNSKQFMGDIGILCDLSPRKRVYELILTFYDLAQQRDDLKLHIGGGPDAASGDYHIALLALVKKLNLQDKVIFYGNLPEPWEFFRKIDIFISNGYSEGLQVAPIEAMASGCYCLAHHWDGAEELLPEPYLYYTDRQLQEKILCYCDTPELERQQQREYMRSIVCEKFNINRTKIQIREITESVGANILARNR